VHALEHISGGDFVSRLSQVKSSFQDQKVSRKKSPIPIPPCSVAGLKCVMIHAIKSFGGQHMASSAKIGRSKCAFETSRRFRVARGS